jgi:hypothetical protein
MEISQKELDDLGLRYEEKALKYLNYAKWLANELAGYDYRDALSAGVSPLRNADEWYEKAVQEVDHPEEQE